MATPKTMTGFGSPRLTQKVQGGQESAGYVHNLHKYEFDLQFDIPVTYPSTAPELKLPQLDGKTHKMYRGGKICLTVHFKPLWGKNCGGLRLKRDITEYGDFVCSFNAPSVDEKFELLGIMANVFIVAPKSLSTLFEGTPSIRKDAQRFIQLREDYKSAKLAARLSSLWQSSN